MTMVWTRWVVGIGATWAVLAATGSAQADVFVRLGGDDAAQTVTLGLSGGVDTVPASWRWRGYYGRPYAYYPYRAYYPGVAGYYPYRAYYPGVAFSFSYYRPYVYRPYYSFYYPGYYRPYVYSYVPRYYSSYYGFWPIGGDAAAFPSVTILGGLRLRIDGQEQEEVPIPRATPPADGTYPYDGGPANPVPMPNAEPAPSVVPVRPAVPRDGRAVSLPAQPSRFAYPAYGEGPVQTSFAKERTVLVKDAAAKKPSR
jgi:hypothetical protein